MTIKFSIIVFVSMLFPIEQFAQKKPLSIDDLANNWSIVSGAKITNDGQYVLYEVSGVINGNGRLIIEKLDLSWRIEVPGAFAYNGIFSQDSRSCYYKQGDTVTQIVLGTEKKTYFNAGQFQIVKYGSDNDWIILRPKGQSNELIIIESKTGVETKFHGIISYQFSKDGKYAVFVKQQQFDSIVFQTMHWYRAESRELLNIWKGDKVLSFVLNESGDQIAFSGRERSNGEYFIFCYKDGELSAKKIISADTILTNLNSKIDQIKSWSLDNERIFVTLRTRKPVKEKEDKSNVEILNATNVNIDYSNPTKDDNFLAAINIGERRLIQLEKSNQTFITIGDGKKGVLVRKGPGASLESGWNASSWVSLDLESAINGQLLPITKDSIYRSAFWPFVSLKGKYVIYYDVRFKSYFSYSVSSGSIVNITNGIDAKWSGFPIWGCNDDAVLLEEEYDIWKVDPAGKQKPINITNNYGKTNHIFFQLAFKHRDSSVQLNGEIILSGFNRVTKDDGFYKIQVGKSLNPYPLVIGKYIYNGTGTEVIVPPPIGARDSKTFLIMRMSENEAPNYFVTKDFKEFSQISNISPQINYNWLTTSLISYKGLNKMSQQGILYKPENFDPFKKYPVIIHYYERFADRLHAFLMPAYNSGDINIPYYVSNGYLVFTPDIKYKVGEPGKSAFDNVLGIYNYLKQLKFIDAKRIAIQGHSFGGFETNYIATHTNLFACAMSASGPTDLISSYNSFRFESIPKQAYYENEQGRIGFTLWERPDLYIKNSPIFSVNKISKPLLLMHNRNDKNVNFRQTEEFYLALRRLRKTAWVLQYNDGGHIINQPGSQRDFTIRVTQYYDHYLKGHPPPIWMTTVNSTGYGLDPNGSCSKGCAICKKRDYDLYYNEIEQSNK